MNMSTSTLIEWLFVFVFFVCFFIACVGEILWLRRKPGIELKRALIFVLSSNFITITVGFFVSFVIFAILLMLAWDGSIEKLPGGEASMIGLVAVMALFPIVLMMLWKRLLLKLLKFTADIISPWRYSLAASILFFVVVIGIPVGSFYLLYKTGIVR